MSAQTFCISATVYNLTVVNAGITGDAVAQLLLPRQNAVGTGLGVCVHFIAQARHVSRFGLPY